jgi:hypothetical protein
VKLDLSLWKLRELHVEDNLEEVKYRENWWRGGLGKKCLTHSTAVDF